MNFDAEHIENLILEALDQSISEEDRLFLQHAIDTDPEVKKKWESMNRELMSPAAQQARKNMLARLNPFTLLQHVQAKRRQARIRISAGIAATVLLLVGTLYFLQPSRNIQPLAGIESPKKRQVELMLANGTTINLSDQEGKVNAGGLQFNNNNKTLSYDSRQTAVTEWGHLTVPPGQDYNIQLADGTSIHLNAGSSLRFPLSFNGDKREINISGEAFLEVAKNPAKPFIVHLPGSSIQVLGTAFNVNTYDAGLVKVALVSGAVKMKAGPDSLVLRPGQQLTWRKTQGMQIAAFDPEELLSWRKGLFFFNNATLAEVSRVIPRWYGVDLVMDHPETGNRRFFGIIDRSKPVKAFLENLKAVNGINYYMEGETIHLN